VSIPECSTVETLLRTLLVEYASLHKLAAQQGTSEESRRYSSRSNVKNLSGLF